MTGPIGFFQYELSHPNNAPHTGMCLLLSDARDAGLEVDAAVVHVGAIDALIDRIRNRRYELVALDSVFTVLAIGRIKGACPDVPLLVGGANAATLMMTSPVDYAVCGPGRLAMRCFLRALSNGDLPQGIPNLFYRQPDGTIDHTGESTDWDLSSELEPYTPALDWGYLGPPRTAGSNTRFASVVPEFGCEFRRDAFSGRYYDRLPAETPNRFLDAQRRTARARRALNLYVKDTRGCAFCVFRFQDHLIASAVETARRAVQQMKWLQARYELTEFSIQSEAPFRFMEPLLDEIQSEEIPVNGFLLRTYPAALLRDEERIARTIEKAVAFGIRIRLQQLGFESFVQSELDHLGKGISVDDNLRAARFLSVMQKRWPNSVEMFKGHGLILFTPWTRPEDVAENMRIIRDEVPFLAASVSTGSRLCFYDPFNPVYRLAESDGLTVSSPRDYGLDFRFEDERTDLLTRLAVALEGELIRQGIAPGPPLSRSVLAAVVPLFMTTRPMSPESRFREAEEAAKRNLGRDSEVWRVPARQER